MKSRNKPHRPIILVCTLLSFVILLSFISQASSSPQEIIEEEDSRVSRVTATPFTDFRESAWIWIDHSGWINTRAEMESRDLGFGEQNLNLFIASYPDIYEKFDHANWWFRSTDDPRDRNAELNIQFRTSDAELALNYANLIVEFVSRELIVAFEFEGTSAWKDWRGDQQVDLTNVHYRAHVDWPWFTKFLNKTIPRDIGGLAETIDVTGANHINAWAWPSGDYNNPEVTFAFGFEFGLNIYDLTGSYSYSGSPALEMNELLHTKKIQVSDYQDHLWLNFALPDVQSLSHNPILNSTTCEIYARYHPSPEPWVKHHYWDVDFQVFSGEYTDLSVSFTYDFIPWFLQTRMEAAMIINHYGYVFKGINLRGDFTRIIDYSNITLIPNWDPNVRTLEMTFRPSREDMWNNFELAISYPDYEDHYANANALALDIASVLGISYTDNHSHDYRMDWERLHYEGYTYRFQSDDFNQSISQSLLDNSDIIQSTPAFDNQDLPTMNEYRQWSVYHGEADQWIDETDFQWNLLAEEVVNPTKAYSGIQTSVTIDLLSEWGWSSFPYSQNYSVSRFDIIFPQDESNGYSVYPRENNGWGWYINTWDEHWQGLNYVNHNLETFTEASSLQFTDEDYQPNGTIFDQFGVIFDYDFYDDTEDTIPPEADIYYYNETSDEEYWDNWYIQEHDVTFSGIDDHLHVRVRDDSSHGIHQWWWPFYYAFWNETSEQWEQSPRFSSSGLKKTTVKAYFAGLPVKAEQFEREIPIIINWENENEIDYNISWDTLDGFADGEWTLIAHAEDNNGYVGDNGLYNLLVDNYDDELYIEGPQITVLSTENDSVSDTHTIEVNVTDDVDVFAVILTRDATGWILNDTDGDGIYESDWNTLDSLRFPENSIHFFTITAWDMDGHKEIYGFWLKVDNIVPGDPPSIDFNSPSSKNETLTGVFLFAVNVTDDQGIISVKMQIDSDASLSMNYNDISGYHELSYNVSKLTSGYHWLHITVVDIDENQHTITEKIDFTVVGGQEKPIVSNPPEWDPGRSELPENLSDYIDAGNFLDYQAEPGDIDFKVAIKDDNDISAVEFTVYSIDSFDPNTGEPSMSDARKEFSTDLDQSGSDGEWDLYDYSWDSTSVADNYYLCEIVVQDNDEVVNHLYIRIILEIDNVEDQEPPVIGAPGFEADVILLGLACWITINILTKNRQSKRKGNKK